MEIHLSTWKAGHKLLLYVSILETTTHTRFLPLHKMIWLGWFLSSYSNLSEMTFWLKYLSKKHYFENIWNAAFLRSLGLTHPCIAPAHPKTPVGQITSSLGKSLSSLFSKSFLFCIRAHLINKWCCNRFRGRAKGLSQTYTRIHSPPNSLPIQAATSHWA